MIKLGEESATDDEEGEKTKIEVGKIPAEEDIRAAVNKFIGEIEQVPPVYSAVKIAGKEAYKLARKGMAPEMKPRKVFVKNIEVVSYDWPYLKLRVVTGPGVYIRSLARDIGRQLMTGGYMAELTRTRVGEFTLDKCLKVEDFGRLSK